MNYSFYIFASAEPRYSTVATINFLMCIHSIWLPGEMCACRTLLLFYFRLKCCHVKHKTQHMTNKSCLLWLHTKSPYSVIVVAVVYICPSRFSTSLSFVEINTSHSNPVSYTKAHNHNILFGVIGFAVWTETSENKWNCQHTTHKTNNNDNNKRNKNIICRQHKAPLAHKAAHSQREIN